MTCKVPGNGYMAVDAILFLVWLRYICGAGGAIKSIPAFSPVLLKYGVRTSVWEVGKGLVWDPKSTPDLEQQRMGVMVIRDKCVESLNVIGTQGSIDIALQCLQCLQWLTL